MPPAKTKDGTKNFRKSISLDIKLEVLRRLDAGEKISQISATMKLAKSTVQTVRDNKYKIRCLLQSVHIADTSGITRNRPVVMQKMESLLCMWIDDNAHRQLPLSTTIIQEKAKSIFETLRANEEYVETGVTFEASRGWFDNFKRRNNLDHVNWKAEIASGNTKAAQEYPNMLRQSLQQGDYTPDQVFNAHEIGLHWQSMPGSGDSKRTTSDCKEAAALQRLTLLLVANASGDLKLPPLLVYNCEEPESDFYNVEQLPVLWRVQRKAWLTNDIFDEWFSSYFCPEIASYLRGKQLPLNALLLLDNALPSSGDETAELSVEMLSKNSAALPQALGQDQDCSLSFKAHYLRLMLEQLSARPGCSVTDFCQRYSLQDAISNINQTWQQLNAASLHSCWPATARAEPASFNTAVAEVVATAQLLKLPKFSASDVQQFLLADREPLSNEELLQLSELVYEEDPLLEIEEPQAAAIDEQMPMAVLKSSLGRIDEALNQLQAADPRRERSSQIMRAINAQLLPYRQILKQQLKAKKNEAKRVEFLSLT